MRPRRWRSAVFAVTAAILWLLPTYLLIVNAATPASRYTGRPGWIPNGFGLISNIQQAWEVGQLGPAAWNSLLYAVISAGAAVVVAALAGFAITVMPVHRTALWFWLIYAGALLPLQVFVRPLFSAAVGLGLYDTRLGLGLVYVAICIPFAFFLVRNFMITLPPEITEAAKLDGAGWWRTLRSIHIPLAMPALRAAFIFQFIWVWNELLFGITLTLSPDQRPVMAALAGLQGAYASVTPPVVLAAALAVSMPTVLIFIAFQRGFVSSLRTTV